MDKIPTAFQFLSPEYQLLKYGYYPAEHDILIEFAKLHVQAALKAASQKACVNYEYDAANGNSEYSVAESTIINAYPLTNIK